MAIYYTPRALGKMTLSVVFAGTPAFAAAYMDGLLAQGINIVGVISQPDKAGKRGQKPRPGAVKSLALARAIAVIQPTKLTAEDLAPFQADMLVVVAYGQILTAPVLALPKLGCINVHGSLLPRWRGAAPIQRAILAGDSETGVCIMQMDEGLDTGHLLSRSRVPISATDNSQTLADKLVLAGIPALVKVISQLASGSVKGEAQSESGITYARKITKLEALCRWQDSSRQVRQAIAGYYPNPVSFTYLGKLRVKLIDAEVRATGGLLGAPGQILAVSKDGVLVACGTGSVWIKRLQLPIGKGRILTAADILNARSNLIHNNTRFHSVAKQDT